MTKYLFDGRSFSAFLFDMDGTVITSVEAAEKVWTIWGKRHGLDAKDFLHDIHGQRAVDSVRRLNIPGVDPVAEAAEITRMELDEVEGIRPIAGVREFLTSLPADRWAIVTSAPRALAVRRLEAAGLELPKVLIAAEDVTVGKPDPSGYQLAAKRLGTDAKDCVVFEDAIAGIRAGEAAGANVIVITATHFKPMLTTHPAIRDFEGLKTQVADGRIQLAAGG